MTTWFREEIEETLAQDYIGGDPEGTLSRRVEQGDTLTIIEFHNGIHGAVQKGRQFELPITDFRFAAQALQFGRGPRGENAENGHQPRGGWKGATVHHRHMPEDSSVDILERDSQVTDRAGLSQIRVQGIEVD